MKAYQVRDIHHYEGMSDVVFANNVQEAKKKASTTHVCCEAEWIDIRVNRLPEIDGMQDYERKELIYELVRIGWWYDFGDFMVTEENLQEAVELGYVREK